MATACDGCLGTGKCWVCLGTGMWDDRPPEAITCPRCEATGVCWLCHDLTVIDLTERSNASGRRWLYSPRLTR